MGTTRTIGIRKIYSFALCAASGVASVANAEGKMLSISTSRSMP
jgi:hypothetical protein